jgi:DNA-binding transcriptional LysR family regulator
MARSATMDEIRIFLQICEARSFAGAATRLGLSPSAVAKSVGRLEDRLGVRLINRTTRQMELTEHGREYRNQCALAIDVIDRVEQDIAQSASEATGNIRISIPPLFGAEIVAPALFRLQDNHPKLALDLVVSSERSDLLREGFDLAVRVGTLPDVTGIIARRIGTQKLLLCASADYLRGKNVPSCVSDLAGHDLISTVRERMTQPWYFRSDGGGMELFKPPARLSLDGAGLTLSAIRSSRGIGMIPAWLVASDIQAGKLVPLLTEFVEGHLPIHLIWVSGGNLPLRMRIVIDCLVDATASLRP